MTPEGPLGVSDPGGGPPKTTGEMEGNIDQSVCRPMFHLSLHAVQTFICISYKINNFVRE